MSAQVRSIWLWRAWAKDRSRICDCGTARAYTEAEARSIAWVTLGGPWRRDVVEMQIEIVNGEVAL